MMDCSLPFGISLRVSTERLALAITYAKKKRAAADSTLPYVQIVVEKFR